MPARPPTPTLQLFHDPLYMNRSPHILWADDEIDLLRPHILFLEARGYTVTGVNSGVEAVQEITSNHLFDMVFLDEQMPGIGGLETLTRIKAIRPHLPVVMITKSEEEHLMEQAIGSKINDYLIKPVNPNQLLLVLKKHLDERRLVSEKAMSAYQQAFRDLGLRLGSRLNAAEWTELYGELIGWKLELEESEDTGMREVLEMQFGEAERQFVRFVETHYGDWLAHPDADTPVLSHRLLPERLPRTVSEAAGRPVYLVVVDNLRWDQWRMIEPLLADRFRITRSEPYFSMLPTATQYARNALFAGMTPAEIARVYPELWVDEDAEGSKNVHEGELLSRLLQRMGVEGKHSYHKVANLQAGKRLLEGFHATKSNAVTAVVYNFVDMLSHARTDMEVIRELASDEAAYRSLTLSWFNHSSLRELLEAMAATGARVVVTTDHGTVPVDQPVVVRGERDTNPNLRYKVGRNLGYAASEVFEVRHPDRFGLPRPHVSSAYIFARGRDFLVYPNNQNHFVQLYRDTFQHGGISLPEVIVPWVELDPR